MNHVASSVAPSERIRGAASEPDTSQPQYLHPEGDGRMESGRVETMREAVMMTKGSDEHVKMEQAIYID